MATFTEHNNFNRLQCSECGIAYYFPEKWCRKAQEKGKGWKCPNGHGQWYGESENDELRRERDRLKQRLAQKDDTIQHQQEQRKAAERSAAVYKGHATRLRKRAKAGVCPCCNRQFVNLHRHMTDKHPDFGPEEPLKLIVGGKP